MGTGPVPVRASAPRPDWTVPPPSEQLEHCPEHGIYQGMLGCRLCDPTLRPLPE